MKTEKGIIAVVYKQGGSNPRFLVLKRDKNWEGWELVKGNLEDDDHEETVRVEVEEEAGISPGEILEIEDLDQKVSWEYERDGEERRKEYRAFLVKVDEDAVVNVHENPHDEHEKGFFFRFRDAEPLLEYENNQEILEKAREVVESEQT